MIEKCISEIIDKHNQADFYLAIINALSKQLPREPKGKDWLYCPVCGKDVLTDKYKFCPDCGQKIDWRCLEDDEK